MLLIGRSSKRNDPQQSIKWILIGTHGDKFGQGFSQEESYILKPSLFKADKSDTVLLFLENGSEFSWGQQCIGISFSSSQVFNLGFIDAVVIDSSEDVSFIPYLKVQHKSGILSCTIQADIIEYRPDSNDVGVLSIYNSSLTYTLREGKFDLCE